MEDAIVVKPYDRFPSCTLLFSLMLQRVDVEKYEMKKEAEKTNIQN